jgi:hypothetical protein
MIGLMVIVVVLMMMMMMNDWVEDFSSYIVDLSSFISCAVVLEYVISDSVSCAFGQPQVPG